MSIAVIFNKNYLTEPYSPRKLKIPHALIKLVLTIPLNAANVLFCSFSLEKSN